MDKIKTISYDSRRYLFYILALMATASLVIYVYAVNSIARNVAVVENLEGEVAEMVVELSSLEFQYISLKNEITLQLAEQYGFKEARNPVYVSRSVGTALTWNR